MAGANAVRTPADIAMRTAVSVYPRAYLYTQFSYVHNTLQP
jgi:hypothetical protein